MRPLLDHYSRPLRDLRISVTDRCNMRCPYCMPKEVFGRGFAFMPNSELLSFEELTRVCRIVAELGVSKIRLTGGEPLLRRELERLVAMLAQVHGIDDIALTTNGILLASKAQALKDAGLSRVTVSLDALDERVFHSMSDTRLPLARILEGIDAADAVGLSPVKINMVVRRGVNDDCVLDMAEYFRNSSRTLRFIEYMDVGTTNEWKLDEVVPAAQIVEMIGARWPLQALPVSRDGEVASRYRYLDGAGEIGFIHSVSEPFCSGCTRARMSADGKLYTCLFASEGHDLRARVRSDASDEELGSYVREIWRARSDRYSAERAQLNPTMPPKRVEMSYIGG
ncbi:MAG TPA: GTP 3',8-cyclase MoaA [Solirubrobacteraceae bacterium]